MGGQFKILDKDATQGDLHDPKTRKVFDALTWGEISKGPDFSIRTKDNVERITFGIRWKKHTFCNCIVLKKDDPYAYDIASRLKIGDPVAVLGRLREYSYTPEKGRNAGKTMNGQDFKVSMIFPLRMLDSFLAMMDSGEAPDLMDAIADFDPDKETEEPEW